MLTRPGALQAHIVVIIIDRGSLLQQDARAGQHWTGAGGLVKDLMPRYFFPERGLPPRLLVLREDRPPFQCFETRLGQSMLRRQIDAVYPVVLWVKTTGNLFPGLDIQES